MPSCQRCPVWNGKGTRFKTRSNFLVRCGTAKKNIYIRKSTTQSSPSHASYQAIEPNMDAEVTTQKESNGGSGDPQDASLKEKVLHALGLPSDVDPANLQGDDGDASSPVETAPSVELKVTHNKQLMSVTIGTNQTVKDLKDMLAVLTGIPADKQKIMWSKGACSDDKTVEQLGAKTGSKFMMVGSSEKEISNVQSKPDLSTLSSLQESSSKAEKLCEQTMHRKVIDKGMPSDVMPGIIGDREALPPFPLSGMLNKRGASVRLTFKLELDQVWIGTKERTEKVQIASIRNVVSEAITGHEEYHLMALQMGPTEASRYWFREGFLLYGLATLDE